jgi:hypothetical protein
VQLPNGERREGPAGPELSTEQNAAGLDPFDAQNVLEEPWRHVQHRNRLACERQRGR